MFKTYSHEIDTLRSFYVRYYQLLRKTDMHSNMKASMKRFDMAKRAASMYGGEDSPVSKIKLSWVERWYTRDGQRRNCSEGEIAWSFQDGTSGDIYDIVSASPKTAYRIACFLCRLDASQFTALIADGWTTKESVGSYSKSQHFTMFGDTMIEDGALSSLC